MIQAVYSSLLAFAIALLIGPGSIRELRRLRFGQAVRQDGPKRHLAKAGIPTMGGVIILIAVAAATFAFARNAVLVPWALFVTLGYGLIGLIDDFLIVVTRRSLGLRARQKLIGQIVIAGLLGLFVASRPELGTTVLVPFWGKQLELGLLYVPFAIFVVVGASNAVNLTDGLDGLAAGATAIAALAYAIIAFRIGRPDLGVFAAAIAGACIGFSWFNAHPAQIFMGDTGSLALGAALGSLAVLTKTELLLVVIGGVFVVETISVIIQVVYFRFTHGKRVFKMSPLHHHFELSGWAEPQVVVRFWIIAAIFAVLGLVISGVW
ncbi:MAG TPA: phospho-N-acetylmuramoyl-pentapeptide-transferase [Firmicutes bacterium]|nr:phospho-N-acetylmuramoyl-pentapeptide-transferase [Bacillota bacterium]